MSQKLALFPIALADTAESAAWGLLMLLVLAAGFVTAWLIQSARRREAIQELIDRQLEGERAQIEESRLLAEDLAEEQANRLAQQARRIEHLKRRLAQQLARSGQGTGDRSTDKAGAPAHPTADPQKPASPLIAQAAQVAARAASTHRAALTARQVSAATAAIRTHLHHNDETARPAGESAPAHLCTRTAHDTGLGGAELMVLRRQLALEQRNTREKARLLRHYEQDAAHWHLEWLRAGEQHQRQQASIVALEKLLDETRRALIEREFEAGQLRERLRQQQGQSLMEGAQLARDHTSSLRQRGKGEDPPKEGSGTADASRPITLAESCLGFNGAEQLG